MVSKLAMEALLVVVEADVLLARVDVKTDLGVPAALAQWQLGW